VYSHVTCIILTHLIKWTEWFAAFVTDVPEKEILGPKHVHFITIFNKHVSCNCMGVKLGL
jgi:hypothetical protein